MTLVRLKPTAPRSQVKHSTTEPLRSLEHFCEIILNLDSGDVALRDFLSRALVAPLFGQAEPFVQFC